MPQDFSVAFQQMASFLAISKLKAYSDILDELIQQSLAILSKDRHRNAQDICDSIKALFGLQLRVKDVETSLEKLINQNAVSSLPNGQLVLEPKIAEAVEIRISEARSLESKVRDTWIAGLNCEACGASGDEMWRTLTEFLKQSFRRHGIQVAALIDPSFDIAQEQWSSLSYLVDEIVARSFRGKPEQQRKRIAARVAAFFDPSTIDQDRARLISALADSAFNYFSLSVAPDISKRFREKLNNLTVFMDTNFLFGILKLHVNTQVDVSEELVKAISGFHLPFKLRYHEATSRELTSTLTHYGLVLRSSKWPQSISRAARQLGELSGIELKYHELNSKQKIDVNDFLEPYQQWQVLLKAKGIDVYRENSDDARLRRRADLEDAYRKYFAQVGKEKSIESIQHDMAVLETVRSMRIPGRPALDSGAVLLTCDYHLFRFDNMNSRQSKDFGSTIMPSVMWQILRPFVADSPGYDKAFAESFGIPEFALSKGRASKAASRMLSILASYSEFPEETATRMLSNSMVLSQLEGAQDDDDFVRIIDNEIARQNTVLMEELAQSQREQEEAWSVAREAESKLKQTIEERDAAQRELSAARMRAAAIESSLGGTAEKLTSSEEQLSSEKQARGTAESTLSEQEGALRRIKRILGLAVGAVVGTLFYLLINTFQIWPWLENHPRTVGVQVASVLLILLCALGVLDRPLRKIWFLAVIVPVVGGLITIL